MFVQVKSVGRFKETKRTDGISTSDVIMRIVKDYNEYVMRNLARGYTRKDLGVSYVKVCFTLFAFSFLSSDHCVLAGELIFSISHPLLLGKAAES